MKIPRRKIWGEGVGGPNNMGAIHMDTLPWPIWLAGKWLELGDEVVHVIERRLPVDERGWSALDRLTPYWGNFFCAAYCIGWVSHIENRYTRQEVWVEVPRNKLSAQTQEWARKLDEEMK